MEADRDFIVKVADILESRHKNGMLHDNFDIVWTAVDIWTMVRENSELIQKIYEAKAKEDASSRRRQTKDGLV